MGEIIKLSGLDEEGEDEEEGEGEEEGWVGGEGEEEEEWEGPTLTKLTSVFL